jgi:hypothetical protein
MAEVGLIELELGENEVANLSNTPSISLEVLESIYGESLYKLKIEDLNPDRWNSVAQDAGASWFRLRWGHSSADNQIWSEWRTIRMRNMVFRSLAQSFIVELLFSDASFLLKHRCPQNIYNAKTIPEIVQQIAEEHGILYTIDEFLEKKFTLYQCGMNDYDFIKTVLIPRSGEYPVLFYVDKGNRLIVEFRNKHQLDKITFSIQGEGTDVSVPLAGFIGSVMIGDSNFGKLAVTFDALKKQTFPFYTEFKADDNADLPEDPFTSIKPPVLAIGNKPAIIQNVVIENPNDIDQEMMKSRVDWKCSNPVYRVALPTYLLPKAELALTVNLEGNLVSGKETFCGGDYLLYSLYTKIAPGGGVGTTIFAERRGLE